MIKPWIVRLFVIFSLLALLAAPQAAIQAAPASAAPAQLNDPAELEAFMDGVFAAQMQSEHIAGAVISVVRGGKLFFAKGYGYSDVDARTPVDPAKTLFRPGSVSKLFVWTAVMQLVEQGKLSLDEDVNTYLDFSIPATFPQPVTLANLLTHTAGFEDAGEDLFKLKAQALIPLDTFLKTHIPARIYPPGKVIAYSNYGAALAGYIVERTAGMAFTDYADMRLLHPLGMTQSTFRQPLPPELAPDMSTGYTYQNGAYLPGSFEFVVPYPAGSMSVTALDMTRFMIAHLQDGRYEETQILSAATAQKMHSQAFTPDPRLHDMAYGFFETVYNGQRIISHGGDTLLFHSGLYLLLDQDTGVFISTNTAGGGKLVAQAFRAFMERYFPAQPASKVSPQGDAAARRAQLAGEYYSTRSNFTHFEKVLGVLSPISVTVDPQGYVLLALPGETMRLVEVGNGLYLGTDDPAEQMVVKTDALGGVTLLLPGPMELVKTPWYGTSSFLALLLGAALLLFVGTLVGWTIAFLRGLFARKPQTVAERQRWQGRLARLAAVLFGLVLLAYLLGLGSLAADTNPAFGVPNLFFETPPSLGLLMALPVVLLALGASMLVFAVLNWGNEYWRLGGKLWYTLLALSAGALLWALYFWNMLL